MGANTMPEANTACIDSRSRLASPRTWAIAEEKTARRLEAITVLGCVASWVAKK